MIDTVVNCSGLSVSAQRWVSPKRSFSRCASVSEYRRRVGSILIWQRSAIASTRCPLVSAIRSVSDIDGVTAYFSGWAPTQSKASSAMSRPLAEVPAPRPDAVEEIGDALPGLGAAVKAAPVQPHPPGQFVAGVDRDQEALHAVGAARDQDGLDVGLGRADHRAGRADPAPGLQVEAAFGGPGRTRVERGHGVIPRRPQEERQP